MSYDKTICVLSQYKQGFSQDGQSVGGIVRLEKYNDRLTINLSFANLSEVSRGRYLFSVYDGTVLESFETTAAGGSFTRLTHLSVNGGLCALMYVDAACSCVAYSFYGNFSHDIRAFCDIVSRAEIQIKPIKNDKIIEIERLKSDLTDIADIKDKKAEPSFRVSEPPETEYKSYDDELVATQDFYALPPTDFDKLGLISLAGDAFKGDCSDKQKAQAQADGSDDNENASSCGEADNGAACAEYYGKIEDDLKRLFKQYPADAQLNERVDGSQWIKIEYGEGKYYSVGVIIAEGAARFITYAVPAAQRSSPPASLEGLCSFLPLYDKDINGAGYWLIFQDAATGESVNVADD